MLIPQRAVNELQGVYQVAVVGADNKANVRIVKLGPRIGTSWIVEEGLAAGELVVVEGFSRVKDGQPVTPKEAPAATASTTTAAAGR